MRVILHASATIRSLRNAALFLAMFSAMAMSYSTRLTYAADGAEAPWRAASKRGVVVGGGSQAVDAGAGILSRGGNAADAAAATILALSVTDSTLFCFGGEVPIMVYDAKSGGVEVIAGQGVAPRLATLEHFSTPEGIPATGLASAAVPAAFDAIITLLDRHGTMRLSTVAEPMLAILDQQREPWHPQLARTVRRLIDAEQTAASDRRRGLRLAADCFYRGGVAHDLSAWLERNGGLIRSTDLATHVTRIEEPVTANYRGFTIVKCGAWTQGPYLLQTLQLLEHADLRQAGHNSAETIHLAIEASKLALADRDVYYADPLFADVPTARLLSPDYAALRWPLVDRQRASREQRPGDPRGMGPLLASSEVRAGLGGPARDTTTCLVADAAGNVIAATPSGWSGVQAGETGIWLGTRLQSFNTWRGHPNCIEPGKRPRITLTPTLVLKDGKPVMAVSVAGGDGQDQATLNILLSMIDAGRSPAEAVTDFRWGTNHHVSSFRQTAAELGSLVIEREAPDEVKSQLRAKGHDVRESATALWAPIALRIDAASGSIEGAGDPRAHRHARGVE